MQLSRRTLILIAGAFVVLLLGWWALASFTASRAEFKVISVPYNATLTLVESEKQIANDTSFRLATGTYSVRVEREGFESETVQLSATSNAPAIAPVVLTPQTQSATTALYDQKNQALLTKIAALPGESFSQLTPGMSRCPSVRFPSANQIQAICITSDIPTKYAEFIQSNPRARYLEFQIGTSPTAQLLYTDTILRAEVAHTFDLDKPVLLLTLHNSDTYSDQAIESSLKTQGYVAENYYIRYLNPPLSVHDKFPSEYLERGQDHAPLHP